MQTKNDERVKIEEISFTIEPSPGVDVYDAVQSAELRGYESIVIDRERNVAIVTIKRAHV